MLHIKGPGDIARAKDAGQDVAVLDLVADQLRAVVAAYAEAGAVWDPEEHGHFVVLQAGDDPRGLAEAGLNPQDDGLLGACWEACEWHNEAQAWAVTILHSNDSGVTVVVPAASWVDPELRAKLEDESANPWHKAAVVAGGERTPF